jgi:hypothetical protein
MFPIGTKGLRDGRRARCRVCYNAQKRDEALAHRAANPLPPRPKARSRTERWRNDPEWREKQYNYIKQYRKTAAGKAKRNARDRKRREDPAVSIPLSIAARIRAALKGRNKSARTIELLGCSVEQVIAHLQSLWLPGMNWENYGIYRQDGPMTWHIDHMLPCAAFDLTKPEEQRKCFHWSNLQPLWAIDNMVKSDWVSDYQI